MSKVLPPGVGSASPSAARSSGREGALGGAALARHHRVALAVMAPAGGDGEILAGHVAPAGRGGDGDTGDLGPQRRKRDAGDGGVGIEQRGEVAPARRRPSEFLRRALRLAVRPARQRDARTFGPKRIGVESIVIRIVQHPGRMMKKVCHIRAESFQIGLSGVRQIRTALPSVGGGLESVIVKQRRDAIDTAIHLIEVADVCNNEGR